MAGIGRTIAGLSQNRRAWAERVAGSALKTRKDSGSAGPNRLKEVPSFGPNPGNLRMFTHLPERLSASPALVVVLHGCTQSAEGYDHGAGWSTLADRYGFALLVPEQKTENNMKTCFNWFLEEDTARGRGEAASIRQMVERMTVDHGIDPRRIFVTGLSAGGAMTAAMLAAYPDVFAGGAILAGLPYRSATSVAEAFESMFQGRARPAREWGDLVRAASPHAGPWPKVSIWHGTADATVVPANAGEIVKQWTDVHGLALRPSRQDKVDGFPRRVWVNQAGEEVIEEFTIAGMAHGTPLATGTGENRFGHAGPFLLDVGISSSYHIATFWGLTAEAVDAISRPARELEAEAAPSSSVRPQEAAAGQAVPSGPAHPPDTGSEQTTAARPAPEPAPREVAGRAVTVSPPGRPEREEAQRPGQEPGSRGAGHRPRGVDIEGIITKALRAAGLMK